MAIVRSSLRNSLCKLLFLLVLIKIVCEDTGNLLSMSIAELQELEAKLVAEVQHVDRTLAGLKEETTSLKADQKAIELEAEKLLGAHEWEKNEKVKKEKELEEAKRDVQAKQESMARMSSNVSELRDQIKALEVKLRDLSAEKAATEKRYHDPSLTDVLNLRSQNWGTTSRNVYNKTLTNIVPVINEFSETARQYKNRVRSTSRATEILVSLIIYGFVLSFGVVTYNVYKKVRGNLTINRMLFIGDAFCACFWFVVLLCFCVLLKDPLMVVQQRSSRLFFIYQLFALVSYVAYVMLRILVLASKMTMGALGELLAVIIVGHHFYVRVWQPAMTDNQFQGTFFYYFCYAWLFTVFAYNRIQEFAPLKQLRGPSLPPNVWFNILKTRFMSSDIPDGDIETSSAFGEDSEATHDA